MRRGRHASWAARRGGARLLDRAHRHPAADPAILGGIAALAAARSADGGEDAAEAIRTTDTRRKEATATRGGVTVGGMAKGAAMLAPNMATMLAVLTTDAEVDQPTVLRYLQAGVGDSFNRLSSTAARPPTTP